MIKGIRLDKFKCFKDCTTINFSQINLLTGENNTGKYTVLEALIVAQKVYEENNKLQDSVLTSNLYSSYRCEDTPHTDPFVIVSADNGEMPKIYFVSTFRGINKGVYDELPKIEEVLFDKPPYIDEFIQHSCSKNLRFEGMGYRCIRDILKAMYLAKENSIVMIEYPEIGIHPSVLSKLIEFIIKKSTEKKIQLFIKTNSEYIINGLRIAVIDGLINNSDVRILDFRREEKETPSIIEIRIDNNGNLNYHSDRVSNDNKKDE
jgi:predicted ATPase